MEQNESTISSSGDKIVIRSITNNVDTLMASAYELDDLIRRIKLGETMTNTYANRSLLSIAADMTGEVYRFANWIREHVTNYEMLKEDE